ncbi:MAG TPA: carbohydrate porin [Polyangiaceae bacterium]
MRTLLLRGAAALLILTLSVPARADEPPAPPPPAAPAPAPVGTMVPPAAPTALRTTPIPAAPPPIAPSTPAPVAPSTPIALPPIPGDTGHFEFGSYGRVVMASDLRGGTGRDANVIAHGDRIDEDSYAELELRREDRFTPSITTKVVWTLGFFPPFFHFSGDQAQAIAIRNLYAQASYDDLTLWVGSRMYRGDDIYLLDWWPLDNQNTVGGGVGYRFKWRSDETDVAAHVGMQRLDSTYQYEQVPAPTPNFLAGQTGPGAENVTTLDRPRTIETLKLTHLFKHPNDQLKDGFKVVVYGEAQEISAGVYTDTTVNPNVQYGLPADTGWLAGTEVAYWTGQRDTFVQLFFRHAEGIAAYDPLAVPLTFANDRTTRGSKETLIALGANYELGAFGLLVGGYLRSFRDGDPSPTTSQKYDEGILAVRPQIFVGQHWGVALEGAFEARRFAMPDPNTDQPLVASEWRAGVMPYFSPSGRGSYKRPQLRIIYALTARNDATRQQLYPAADVFSQRSVSHFLGLGAEWWFNSSSYP